MTGAELRKQMNESLKKIVISHLREQGFQGSLPHFRRIAKNQVNLITFQFRYGGTFVIEFAQGSPEGFMTYWGKYIPAQKLTAHDLNNRHRVGQKLLLNDRNDGRWFDYKNGNTDQVAEEVLKKIGDDWKYWEVAPVERGSKDEKFIATLAK